MRRESNPDHVTSFDGGGDGFSKMKDFGFHGSIEGSSPRRPHLKGSSHEPGKPAAGKGSTNPIQTMEGFAGGGYAGGGESRTHPHGSELHSAEDHHDGTATHHYKHGGYSKFHEDGTVTHHTADGGMAAGGSAHDYAGGGMVNAHPHGHAVTGIESSAEMPDREIHRHAHGGFTVHYHDGRDPTHHTHDGTPAYHAGGSPHDEAAEHSYAEGGDVAQDRAMVARGVHQHEDQQHDGEHSKLNLARGGRVKMPGMMPGMPSMSPHKAKAHKAKMPKAPPMDGGALSNAMPINRPPRNPERSVTPRNQMPGGVMPYGVQPSAEPDASQGAAAPGSPGVGAPSMRRGGRAKRYADGGSVSDSKSDDDDGGSSKAMTPDEYNRSQGLLRSGFYRDRAEAVQDRILNPDKLPVRGMKTTESPSDKSDTGGSRVRPLDSFSIINKALTK